MRILWMGEVFLLIGPAVAFNLLYKHAMNSWRTEKNQFLQVHQRSHFKKITTTATRNLFPLPSIGSPTFSSVQSNSSKSLPRDVVETESDRKTPNLSMLIGMKIDSFLGFSFWESVSNWILFLMGSLNRVNGISLSWRGARNLLLHYIETPSSKCSL